jgi:hypothetical protein
MAKFISSAPVVFVRDVRASAEHYRDTMGFRFDGFHGDPPSFVILSRDGLCVMLKSVSDHSAIIPRGAKIDYELCDQPYGCREFGTQDIDGHDIGFGQDVSGENSN